MDEKINSSEDVKVSALVAVDVETFKRLQSRIDNLTIAVLMCGVGLYLASRMLANIDVRLEALEALCRTRLS